MSKVITVEGTAKYAKVFEWNRDKGGSDSKGNTYPEATTINLVLEPADLKALTKEVSTITPRVTDDGFEVKIRRQWNNPVPERGGAPLVTDAEGNPFPEKTAIGNGSKVKVAVEVYPTKYGNAGRLMAVKVLDLVEYEMDGEIDTTPAELPADF